MKVKVLVVLILFELITKYFRIIVVSVSATPPPYNSMKKQKQNASVGDITGFSFFFSRMIMTNEDHTKNSLDLEVVVTFNEGGHAEEEKKNRLLLPIHLVSEVVVKLKGKH